MWIPKATLRQYLILLNHDTSVFLNATGDQVLRNRMEELANAQLLDIYTYNILEWLFVTPAGDKTNTLEGQGKPPQLLGMPLVAGMVQRYLGKSFHKSSQGIHKTSCTSAVLEVRVIRKFKN